VFGYLPGSVCRNRQRGLEARKAGFGCSLPEQVPQRLFRLTTPSIRRFAK
jgi:hypothetical protein